MLVTAYMKLLLIEDNPTDAKLLCLLLKSQGIVVRTALSLETARAEITLEKPDVVLSDLGLHDASGDEIFSVLRELLPDTALVAYSGATPRDKLNDADAFLLKDGLSGPLVTWVLHHAMAKRKEFSDLVLRSAELP